MVFGVGVAPAVIMTVLTLAVHREGPRPMPSSPSYTLVDQFDEDEFPDIPRAPAELLAALATVPDPRAAQGRRHPLPSILAIAGCAVVAGAKSLVAIAEWAVAATPATLVRIGVDGDPPCESTIRRTLQRLHADGLDIILGTWAALKDDTQGRRVIAIDGKSIRGAIGSSGRCRHLLAALSHGARPGPGTGRCRCEDQRGSNAAKASGEHQHRWRGHHSRRVALCPRPRHLPGGAARALFAHRERESAQAPPGSSPPCPGRMFRSLTAPRTGATVAWRSAPRRSSPSPPGFCFRTLHRRCRSSGRAAPSKAGNGQPKRSTRSPTSAQNTPNPTNSQRGYADIGR